MPSLSHINTEPQTNLTLDHFIQCSPIALVRLDANGAIIEANAAFDTLTHKFFKENPDKRLLDVLEVNEKEPFIEILKATESNPFPPAISLCLNIGREQPVMVSAYATAMKPKEDEPPLLIVHMIDQTEQKNLEMRFAHSQKMQAVGQLAGGVAHDFNNLLTAMIGFCDLLLMRHPAGDPSFADIMQIKQNANRAANLVRQLLAFSRRQTLQPKMLDLTDLLSELSNLIRRLIGENINLNMLHGRDLGVVKADQGQLEQVIINLAVNARDAMPEGGELTIKTSTVDISEDGAPARDMISPEEDDHIVKGEYVLVEITDSGSGIPKNIIKNIFEPFFSTKEVGSGTGLGLSTVYGIVKQTGGYVYIKTEEGKGTSFYIYFKRHQQDASSIDDAQEDTKASDLTGGETIMLVEDETPVRIFAARALKNKGYEVLEADCGENAIEVFSQHSGQVDVIISDVIMPGMNGPKMIESLESQFPDRMASMQIIFISGYAEDAFVDSFGPDREFNFLPKPFTLKQLAAKVKDVIQNKGVDQTA